MDLRTKSLLERAEIEDSKQFSRLAEKTQVVSPKNGMPEVPKNRASHSNEVATSSLILCNSIADKANIDLYDVDYQHAVVSASLLHDIGHPCFGHDGAHFLNKLFRGKGLKEGFEDNNNNLVVIEKNGIDVRDYVKASIIKYPTKLYSEQSLRYQPILDSAIKQDDEHYASLGFSLKKQNKTIACEIMDEADRNSYVCSDLSDFLSMGNKINDNRLKWLANEMNLPKCFSSEVELLLSIANDGNKNDIKSYFSELKLQFNQNHLFTNNGLEHENREIFEYREFLNKVCREFYIKPIRKMDTHHDNMKKLSAFVSYVLEEEFYPSKHYENMIRTTSCELEKLTYIRDMISEVSDWYIIVMYDELNLENRNVMQYVSDAIKTY